jgi:hypothetical protein
MIAQQARRPLRSRGMDVFLEVVRVDVGLRVAPKILELLL